MHVINYFFARTYLHPELNLIEPNNLTGRIIFFSLVLIIVAGITLAGASEPVAAASQHGQSFDELMAQSLAGKVSAGSQPTGQLYPVAQPKSLPDKPVSFMLMDRAYAQFYLQAAKTQRVFQSAVRGNNFVRIPFTALCRPSMNSDRQTLKMPALFARSLFNVAPRGFFMLD